jgi:hypothetical protein
MEWIRKMVAVKDKPRSGKDWDKLALQIEVKLLKRELEHLAKKSAQRNLSGWEEQRLSQIPNDISRILESVELS